MICEFIYTTVVWENISPGRRWTRPTKYINRDEVRLLAERSNTKSNAKLDGFRSQLQASYVSSHTEKLW